MRRSHVDIDVRELRREDRKSDLWTCAKATSSGDTSWRRGIEKEELGLRRDTASMRGTMLVKHQQMPIDARVTWSAQ